MSTLFRFIIHRDRWWLPGWVLGITILMAYVSNVIGLIMDDKALRGFSSFAHSPALVLISGPCYGFDDISPGRFVVGMYGTTFMVIAGLMGIFTVSRHTRAEEQTGRAALVRAGAVERQAPLLVALAHVLFMSVSLIILISGVLYFSATAPESFASTVLFAASIGAVTVVFAGVTAVTTQLSPWSKTSSSMAGALLALSFLLRGIGDMSQSQHGAFGWLSWLSPLGWSLYTAPLTYNRWWPLFLSIGLAALLATVGVVLQQRRDLGAGLFQPSFGAESAAHWLSSPTTLAWKLQRVSLAWWTLVMLLVGLIFGTFAKPIADNAQSFPEQVLSLFGGVDGIVNGYLGFMCIYSAIIISIYVIRGVQAIWLEESSGRATTVLVSPVSRSRWVRSWTLIPLLGTVWLFLVVGIAMGLGAAVSLGDWSLLGTVVLGHLANIPSVWVLMSVTVLLFGTAPRFTSVSWAVLGYCAFISFFGKMLQLDDAVLNTSVFKHIGQYPAGDISWSAVGILTILTGILCEIGIFFFQRRDVKN